MGIYRESGHEHFNGSVVIPIFDARGQVVEMYGRKKEKAPPVQTETPMPADPAELVAALERDADEDRED